MRFAPASPPHLRPATSVSRLMGEVLLALVPATAAYVWYFGPGLLLNMLIATTVAVAAESAVLALRGRPVGAPLSDLSVIVTAVLLAFALPPLTPWWVTATAAFFAVVFGKQLFGGIGYNPFNPAMVGYVVRADLVSRLPDPVAATGRLRSDRSAAGSWRDHAITR